MDSLLKDRSTLLLGLVFLFGFICTFIFSRGRRDVLLNRIHFQRRRTSGSNTPPRSLSPGKEAPENVSIPDYSDTFPPSRRFALDKSEDGSTSDSEKSSETHASPLSLSQNLLPHTQSYLETSSPMFTPTGFSTAEIKALGDFPDYAKLSGVPLPSPYHSFDIKTALPRPYRPFRWNYHQTMCISPLS